MGETPTTPTKKKKEKLPKGVGRLPEWWLEISPHDTLFLKEEEAKKKAEEEEAMKFAQLAELQDLMDKYGGEDFPNWNPMTDGPRTKEEEKEWLSNGYQRNEKKEWVSHDGTPLQGRQFQGKLPPGYQPGGYVKDDDDAEEGESEGGQGTLNSTKYERDKSTTWDKPDWMKVKLRSTGTGGSIRHGEAVERPIIKGDGKVVLESRSIEEVSPKAEVVTPPEEEEAIDHHGREVGEIKSAAEFKPRATGELQAILNRRKQASD